MRRGSIAVLLLVGRRRWPPARTKRVAFGPGNSHRLLRRADRVREATFAQSGRNGARLAVDEINRSRAACSARTARLRVEDDRNEPAEAASAVSKLITRDHVVALIGENASSRSLAAAPIAQSYRVPMISPSSTNLEVTKKGDYIFRACFTDPAQGRALAIFARKSRRAATAAILIDARSDYSVGLAEAFRRDFTAAGGRIVAELKYTEGDSDFTAQLTAIKPPEPDVLFVPGYYTDAGLIARQARGLGLETALLGADGWDSPKLSEIGGDAIDGRRVLESVLGGGADPGRVDPSSPPIGRPTARLPTGSPRCRTTPRGCVADAIRRAGSTEGKRVRDALAATTDFPGVTGTISFDADRNPIKPVSDPEGRGRPISLRDGDRAGRRAAVGVPATARASRESDRCRSRTRRTTPCRAPPWRVPPRPKPAADPPPSKSGFAFHVAETRGPASVNFENAPVAIDDRVPFRDLRRLPVAVHDEARVAGRRVQENEQEVPVVRQTEHDPARARRAS